MEGIFGEVITTAMATLAAGAIALMLLVGRIPFRGKKLNQTKFWHNWGVFILVCICMIGTFAPGVSQIPIEQWGGNVVFGLVASMVAILGRAILKPLIIRKLEGKE